MKSVKTWLLVACVALIGLSAWLAYYAVTPLNLAPSSQEIVIQPKSGLRSIANQLVAQGVIQEPWRFIVL
ncbi:MAG TPA: aminodeoxychorismate lyase, partial [Methylophilaceae bacterium]|nr:aminodeoxychorismate lyase [Methylophilaceae bacterium]